MTYFHSISLLYFLEYNIFLPNLFGVFLYLQSPTKIVAQAPFPSFKLLCLPDLPGSYQQFQAIFTLSVLNSGDLGAVSTFFKEKRSCVTIFCDWLWLLKHFVFYFQWFVRVGTVCYHVDISRNAAFWYST